MKKVIRLTESDLIKLVKRVLKEQPLPSVDNQFSDYTFGTNLGGKPKPTEKVVPTKPKFSCVSADDFKNKGARANSFTYKRPEGEFIYYDDGNVWLYDLNTTKRTKTGKWKCGNNNLEVRWDNDPAAINYQPLPKNAFGKNLGSKDCAVDIKDIFNGKFIMIGCSGDAVKTVQKMLKIKDDGVFGKDTKNAVMMFQKSKGINPDGVVGRDTLSFLQKI